jgi:peroxiredoxin
MAPQSLLAILAAWLGAGGCGSTSAEPAAGVADSGEPPSSFDSPAPSGPHVGLRLGDIAPDVRLAGYREDGTTLSTFSLSELSDADGSKGIHAIVLTLGGLWCPGCVQEGRALSDDYARLYRARGARFVSIEGPNLQADPVALRALDAWRKNVVRSYTVLSDDLWQYVAMAPEYPYIVVIDPRSMLVVSEIAFVDPANRACATDADCCKGPMTVDEYGPLCQSPYQCAAWGLCVATYNPLNPDSHLIPELDELLDLNGAPPGP